MAPHPLLSGGWILKHLIAQLIYDSYIGLGFWQLARLEERRALNAARLAVVDANPVTFTGREPDPAALIGRKVRVTGAYLNAASVVLRGQRSDSGVEGVHLLTPLRIAGSEAAVIVDRGWIPPTRPEAADLAAYAVTREVTVEGLARAPQTRPASPLAPRDLPLPGQERINAWVRVDVARLQAQVPAPLLPLYIEELPSGNGAVLPRPRDPRQLDEGPHLSYAIQWFAFAAILAVVYAALLRQQVRDG
jgi:surfeit locus 1 family protein